MSVRRSADGLWLPLTLETFDDARKLEWPPARSREARDEERAKAASSSSSDPADPLLLWGPPAPPQFAAALKARLVETALGGRLARGFCSKVIGMGVERSVDGGGLPSASAKVAK